MCELFGFSGKNKKELNPCLREFYSHSHDHPDGWGMAVLGEHGFNIEKESLPAYKSVYLRERLKEPIVAGVLLAHIRLATIGGVERKNCHPYEGVDRSGRHWTLIHNGTIFDYPKLMAYSGMQKGTSDSERILLYLIDQINTEAEKKGDKLNKDERFDVIDRMVYDMSEGNKLNLMIYDGELMYVHYNSRDSLYMRKGMDEVMISTKPLDKGEWESFPITQLLAYRDGQRVLTGTRHEHFYVENKEAIRQLYLTYSEL